MRSIVFFKSVTAAATIKGMKMFPFLTAALLPLDLLGFLKTLGPHGTAYVFAFVASVIRIPLFKLEMRPAIVGVTCIPILSFIAVSFHPGILDELIVVKEPAEYPMVFGTIFGLIPTQLGGWVFDYVEIVLSLAKAARAAREGEKK